MAERHYLGFRRFAGRGLRHVAEWRGHWLALAGWQSGAFKCAPRDRWLGELRALGAWRRPRGRWEAPSDSTVCRVMADTGPDALEAVLRRWAAPRGSRDMGLSTTSQTAPSEHE